MPVLMLLVAVRFPPTLCICGAAYLALGTFQRQQQTDVRSTLLLTVSCNQKNAGGCVNVHHELTQSVVQRTLIHTQTFPCGNDTSIVLITACLTSIHTNLHQQAMMGILLQCSQPIIILHACAQHCHKQARSPRYKYSVVFDSRQQQKCHLHHSAAAVSSSLLSSSRGCGRALEGVHSLLSSIHLGLQTQVHLTLAPGSMPSQQPPQHADVPPVVAQVLLAPCQQQDELARLVLGGLSPWVQVQGAGGRGVCRRPGM